MKFVHCSTTGAGKKSAYEIAAKLVENGVTAIELSGGIYDKNSMQKVKALSRLTSSLLIHNYFPIPEVGFVMNLASEDVIILQKSLALSKKAILLSAELNARHYAVHSGFLLDPSINELGGIFRNKKLMDRDVCLAIFKKSICELSIFANKNNVRLLFENNVMNRLNYDYHGQDIFLLSRPEEILEFCAEISTSADLLLDIGHLQVTSKTFKFKVTRAIEQLNQFTGGYHLSENNGLEDEHGSFSIDNWQYKNLIRKDLDYYTLEFKNYDYAKINLQVNNFNSWLN